MKQIESPWIEQNVGGESTRVALAGALLGPHQIAGESERGLPIVSYPNEMADENGVLPDIPDEVVEIILLVMRTQQ